MSAIHQDTPLSLGIEFGSTRVKAVLIGPDHQVVASGSHDWHDTLVDGQWSYSLDDIRLALTDAYQAMKRDALSRHRVKITRLHSLGISAMMHGYLPFDRDMRLLTPFRTWRNTTTGPAAAQLTRLMDFNIPQRWSVAHLQQALLNGEPHVGEIRFLTTLAGYVHFLLCGEKVLGVGDAAGMFPIDSAACDWDEGRLSLFDAHNHGCGLLPLRQLLPKVLPAGAEAGRLTAEGAALLDPDGDLQPGCLLCPPEGDAGTGMVATNSVAPRTGNVSAGTSIFAMIVLEQALKRVHTQVDMVTTPSGHPVAMVHCNTCTSDLNAWAGLFRGFAKHFGLELTADALYTGLFQAALAGEKDGGGLVAFNYYSGEPVTDTDLGCPLFTRRPDAPMTFENFMRTQLYSALATLSLGMKVLTEDEQVTVERVMGHGGLFKTPEVGQRLMAAALHAPVTVMETAGEGGAWGMALLAAYAAEHGEGESLDSFLAEKVFAAMPAATLHPDPADEAGFAAYLDKYTAMLAAEKAAAEVWSKMG